MIQEALQTIVFPTLDLLDGYGIKPDDRAACMLLAIGLQESNLRFRYQRTLNGGKGPARGLWQFEWKGGTKGVLDHHITTDIARHIAMKRVGTIKSNEVWKALEFDDILACAFARLLIKTTSQPLPLFTQPKEGWKQYLDLWRPGKPREPIWASNWNDAVAAMELETEDNAN